MSESPSLLSDERLKELAADESLAYDMPETLAAEINSMAAELLVRREARWQPIETTAKDGNEILSWDGSSVGIIYFDGHDNDWLSDSGHELDRRPTHWMLLPEPPAQTPVDGGSV